MNEIGEFKLRSLRLNRSQKKETVLVLDRLQMSLTSKSQLSTQATQVAITKCEGATVDFGHIAYD